MSDTISANLELTEMENGSHDNTWNDVYIANFQRVENKLTEVTELTTTGGTTTLIDSEEYAAVIDVDGTLVANATIVFSGRKGTWFVRNATTGDFTLTLKVSGQTGVVVAQGSGTWVWCDGTDIESPTGGDVSVAADAVDFTPAGSVAATNVQDAIEELDGDITALSAATTASLAGKQPLDADLTALAALTTTSYGRALLELANQAALTALIAAMVGDGGSGGTKGAVPAPSAGDYAAGKYLDAGANWSVPGGTWTLAATVNVTTDATETAATTGLSIYRVVVIDFAFSTSAQSGQSIRLQCRTSGGTYRTMTLASNSGGSMPRVGGTIRIANFNGNTQGKIISPVMWGSGGGGELDDSNAVNSISSVDTAGYYVSYREIWDDLKLSMSANNILGTNSDQRGVMFIWGFK